MLAFKIILSIGLFFYGIKNMSSSLRKALKDKVKRKIIDSKNNVLGYTFLGIAFTSLIQSSSAVSAVVIALANAGMISLHHGIGIILGANIGTTVTVHLFRFDLQALIVPSILLGVIMKTFKKKGDFWIWFGIAFMGFNMLQYNLSMLKNNITVINFFYDISQKTNLSILSGILIAVVFQSSSVGMGFIVSLVKNGMIDFEAALLIMFGLNIGTCFTAVFVSLGGLPKGKRIAAAHVLFNVIGVLIFLLFFDKFIYMINAYVSGESPVKRLAAAHTIFNTVNAVVFLPFINLFVKILKRIVQD